VGACQGRITRAPRGEQGFGYDPIFEIPETGRTFAEMAADEKNLVSHRGRALVLLRQFLETSK
jgi:XTP/dITP diphosphohydrolase